MQKLVITGVLTFVIGVLVGRMTLTPSVPVVEKQSAGVLSGRVAEVLQVPQYTYLRFDSGEWAAVSSEPTLRVGQDVRVSVQTEMNDFSSPSLGRSFARIAFGSIEGDKPLRVHEVIEERAKLNGRRVTVKGTVDRVNEVQGKHYVHLKEGDDDLLCISDLTIEKGAEVTIEGTVALDKNVGMGVNPVVLEDIALR